MTGQIVSEHDLALLAETSAIGASFDPHKTVSCQGYDLITGNYLGFLNPSYDAGTGSTVFFDSTKTSYIRSEIDPNSNPNYDPGDPGAHLIEILSKLNRNYPDAKVAWRFEVRPFKGGDIVSQFTIRRGDVKRRNIGHYFAESYTP